MERETTGHLNQQEEAPTTHSHRAKTPTIIIIPSQVIQQILTPINHTNPYLNLNLNPNWDLGATELIKKIINMIGVMIVMESTPRTSQALIFWQF